MSVVAVPVAPARTVRHDWRIVAPWYRWARADGLEPERAADAERPALHKFVSTDFVADFLRDPQRSVMFDADVDVVQRIEKVPAAELFAADGRLRSLATRRAIPTDTRKLFLAAHQRFYVVAIGLHCDQPGFPKVDPTAVAEVGFVVRRRRVSVPKLERPKGAALLSELTQARAMATSRRELDAAKERSRILHPFTATSRSRVGSPAAATVSAARQVELSRRQLKVWADQVGVASGNEGWIPAGEGAFGSWVPIADEPDEVVERVYPMRLLAPDPDDPMHAAHDGSIYYAVIPTSSDEITVDGTNRFNERDTYEIRVFAREQGCDGCPGAITWSDPTRAIRLASFYDPTGSSLRPVEVRLPDFAELEASAAMPSVRMSAPAGSHLEFSKFGDIPTKGKQSTGEEICFFSIPLITIIAMFVLNLFLPIVILVFQLWWMLKLKFCIPPSIDFEIDLAAELDVTPPELELMADIDIDVLPGIDQNAVAGVLAGIFNQPFDPALDPVDPEWQMGDRLTDPVAGFTNDPLVKLAVRNGYGSSADAAPRYSVPVVHTTPVRRDQVVRP